MKYWNGIDISTTVRFKISSMSVNVGIHRLKEYIFSCICIFVNHTVNTFGLGCK